MKWPFGIGVLYVFINFPLLIFTKIGITSGRASTRAKEVDRAAPGIPIPVMVMVLPFVYQVEQFCHFIFTPLNVKYYRGDGWTEWFLFPAGVAVFWAGVEYWKFMYAIAVLVLNKYL